MNILNINIQSYIQNIIDAYTKIFGKEYKKIIEEKVKLTEVITYNTERGIKNYVIFLEDCKVRELSIKFLKEIGIDVSSLEGKSYAEEVPNNIKKLINGYIGGYSVFSYIPESNILGIRAFDEHAQEVNKKYEKEIIKNQIDFLNFLLGDSCGIATEEDLEDFKKTDKYREIYKKIQEYIKIYNEIFEEFEEYSKTIEPYREFVRERGEKEISESREYNDVLNKIGKTKENEELLNEIFINGKLFVPIKNANRPRIFYTIENGGVLDYAMLHEFCHVIELQIENGKGVGSGFDNSEEKNLYREEKRKYERLNENITDIFAIEATRILHNRGVYMLEPKELIVNDVWDINTDSITKKMLIPFLEDYKKEIVKARITGDMEGLLNIIGKDNFEELNDCINKVDYLIQKGLKRRLDKNEKNDELIEEYQKELERLDIIYSKMEEYSLEEER